MPPKAPQAEQALERRDAAVRVMRKGSLSFSFAARFLGRRLQVLVPLLYSWCRYCDDVVDDPQNLGSALAVDELRRATWGAMRGRVRAEDPAAMHDLAALAAQVSLPDVYFQELLNGMESDAAFQPFPTLDDLRLYCYRVAGTVGLTFCHLAGVSSEAALEAACELGIAMQLTNIARDVLDDQALGRCYLPLAWLAAEGLTSLDIGKPGARQGVARVVQRLLAAADESYAKGRAGLKFLPWQAALAVAAAARIYQGIGVLVLRRGLSAWDRRAVVPLWRKLMLVVSATLDLGRQWPQRRPFRPVLLTAIWRLT